MAKVLGVLSLATLAALLVLGVGGFNSLNRLNTGAEAVEAQWAQVEAVYQRRADLVPNLVETVTAAAVNERQTLEAVTQARANLGLLPAAPTSTNELRSFEATQTALDSALSRMMVVVERHPQIRSAEAVRDLLAELDDTENRIVVERQRYNEAVRIYNTRRKRIPGAFVARMFNFAPRPYFASATGASNAPKVEFSPARP